MSDDKVEEAKKTDSLLEWSIRHCVDNKLADFSTSDPAPAELVERVAQWHLRNIQHSVRFSDRAIEALSNKDSEINKLREAVRGLEKKLQGAMVLGSRLTPGQRLRGKA